MFRRVGWRSNWSRSSERAELRVVAQLVEGGLIVEPERKRRGIFGFFLGATQRFQRGFAIAFELLGGCEVHQSPGTIGHGVDSEQIILLRKRIILGGDSLVAKLAAANKNSHEGATVGADLILFLL